MKIEELGIGKKKKKTKDHLLYKAFEDVENVPVWQELCVLPCLFVCLFVQFGCDLYSASERLSVYFKKILYFSVEFQ